MLFQVAKARETGVVNIITWFDSLRSPKIAALIKKECGVEISYDEYYFANESIWRFTKPAELYDYDIAILPSETYEVIKDKIRLKKVDLYLVSQEYEQNIKKHYLAKKYPSNVVYFTISVTGFVWNPSVISLASSDSLFEMFTKAGKNIVVMVNSCPRLKHLTGETTAGYAKEFGRVIQDAQLYITNGYNDLYNRHNFAFAYQFSGHAITSLKQATNKSLAFFVHPKYSHFSANLMAALNTRPETICVAKVLASKQALDIVQSKTYFLSPYGTYCSVNDKIFQNVYTDLFKNNYKIKWSDLFIEEDPMKYGFVANSCNDIFLLPHVREQNTLVLKSHK